MKKSTLIFLLLIILLSWSCSNSNTERDIKMYTETWDQIVNNSNIDLINNTNFTDSITLVSNQENIVGIENFKAYYQNFLTGFSDIKFTILFSKFIKSSSSNAFDSESIETRCKDF